MRFQPGVSRLRSGLTCVAIFVAVGTLDAAPTVTVSAGFRGLSSPGEVMPVVVLLAGDGVDRRLHVLVEGSPAVRREVELPRGTTKRIFVYTEPEKGFGAGYPVLTVRDDETVFHEEALRTQRVHFGALLPVVGGPALEIGDVESPTLSPDHLPDRARGYEGLRALAIYPEAWSQLPAPALEALVLWVRQGGVVILPLQYRSAQLGLGEDHPFGPVRLTSSRTTQGVWRGIALELIDEEPERETAERRRLETWDSVVVAEMPAAARERFQVWAVSDARLARVPLIGDQPFGRGRLRFLAFDLSRWARAEVRGPREGFLKRLCSKHNGAFLPASLRAHVLREAGRGSRLLWFFAFLVVYLTLVGPVDFWLVRRLGRPRLTWLTFPAVVLVFCGVAWAMGQGRIGAVSAREFTVVEFLGSRNLGGVGHSYVGVYSDTNQSLSFRPRVRRGEVNLLGDDLDLFRGRWAYDERRASSDLVQKMNIWSTHGYRVTWREREAYLGAWLLGDDGDRRVEIQQALPVAPSGGWVRIHGRSYALTDWKPSAGEVSYTARVGGPWSLSDQKALEHSLDAAGFDGLLFEMPDHGERMTPRLVFVLPEPWNVLEVVERQTAAARGVCVVRCPLVVEE